MTNEDMKEYLSALAGAMKGFDHVVSDSVREDPEMHQIHFTMSMKRIPPNGGEFVDCINRRIHIAWDAGGPSNDQETIRMVVGRDIDETISGARKIIGREFASAVDRDGRDTLEVDPLGLMHASPIALGMAEDRENQA